MIAVVFSVGEETTDICVEALEKQGCEVIVLDSQSSFVDKLKQMCDMNLDELIRVDADIIVNDNLKAYLDLARESRSWCKPYGWIWWDQNYSTISVCYFDKYIINQLKTHMNDPELLKTKRPERYLWCLDDIPTTKVDLPVGIKGYGVRDLRKTISTKDGRGQKYDWDWVRKLNSL